METTAPHTCGTTQPYFLAATVAAASGSICSACAGGLVAFLIPGKRRWLRSLMALIAVAAITQDDGMQHLHRPGHEACDLHLPGDRHVGCDRRGAVADGDAERHDFEVGHFFYAYMPSCLWCRRRGSTASM